MTITESAEIPDLQALQEGLAECESTGNSGFEFIATHMGWNPSSGYTQTPSGAKTQFPLYNDCTVVIPKGRVMFDDDERIFSVTNTAVRVQGSKTLVVYGDSTVAWNPSPCCWDESICSLCSLAPQGQCRRLGIGNVRERKEENPSWWRKLGKRAGFLKTSKDEEALIKFDYHQSLFDRLPKGQVFLADGMVVQY
ncbi:uncharacterized protein F4807DRAFT_434371 [Annulohypoxylon truncatum]|uniref:uncharacterized protein n=1 Tax=Annulohypoxylon truncatum TaxID=327061 RepID=UPI00200894BE|nr:uncharacterized protein F4807DRAFT_434371 [Annulohypoxylon truncatum]KAI1207727.1 hypothetical protein F4807DRAFT_434371 [Annulohypoxylon truncatum]